jgi:hypothetical protein
MKQKCQQPDAPGFWRFFGTIYSSDSAHCGLHDLEVEIDGWLFKLVQRDGECVIIDPESGDALGGKWKGCWVKEEVG